MTDRVAVCDLDGVVYLGDRPIEGSADALVRLERAGFEILFCTNNSSRTRSAVAGKIEAVTGYAARERQVFTSAMAAATLVGSSTGAMVVGGDGIDEALRAAGIPVVADSRGCDTVVVGLDVALTYEKLAEATLAVRAGARLVATNHDATYPTPRGLLPGGGSIVALLECATDVRAEVAGKPHPAMQRLLATAVGAREAWMIGDRVDTDMAMASAAGWHGVLVATGVPRAAHGEGHEIEVPDLASFADDVVG